MKHEVSGHFTSVVGERVDYYVGKDYVGYVVGEERFEKKTTSLQEGLDYIVSIIPTLPGQLEPQQDKKVSCFLSSISDSP